MNIGSTPRAELCVAPLSELKFILFALSYAEDRNKRESNLVNTRNIKLVRNQQPSDHTCSNETGLKFQASHRGVETQRRRVENLPCNCTFDIANDSY